MRGSSKGLKVPIQKKTSNNIASSTISDQTQLMNKTSLSSISSKSHNEDKLLLLKQKLEKQKEDIKKTGRRFKDSSSKAIQIQVQTEQIEQTKPITTKMLYKATKVSTGVASVSGLGSLYDFSSVKSQVEAKTKTTFLKRNNNNSKQPIIPVYTTQQILNSVNSQIPIQKSLSKRISAQEFNITQPKRQTVNLMQLSSVIERSPTKNTSKQKPLQTEKQNVETKFVDLSKIKKSSSKNNQITFNNLVFETAINEQKKRNKEVETFLSQVGLKEFTDELINLGFDEIQTLIEVQVDDLNQVRMRAKQQDKLMNHIKQFKLKHSIQELNQNLPLVDRPSSIKSRLGYRPKSAAMTTEPSETTEISQTSRMRSSTLNFNAAESTLLNKSSIFYFMGGNEWSLESQIRKACSGCFKVSYDAIKRGECYYCEKCDPGQLDELDISLDESMVRNYR